MRNVSDAQRIAIREAMIWDVLKANGVDATDRIGGRVSMRMYARDLALRAIGDFALATSAHTMELKLHELGGDQEAVWRFFLAHYFPDQEPAGEEESPIIIASPVDAQGVIDQAAVFRAAMEKGKPHA